MSPADLTAFLDREFPQILIGGRCYFIESSGPMSALMRLKADERHLRPGGTVSGPSIFTLADLALYVAVLAQIGPIGLAVTTSLTINFLSKPMPGDLLAHCRLLKLGKRLAVGEVAILSDGASEPCAHATGTYSIPPR